MYALLCEKYLPHMYHYNDIIMSIMASQITCVSIVCSTVCWGADQRKHQSSMSLAFVMGIHRLPVDFPYKGTVIRKIVPFDDVSSCWAIIWMLKCQYDIPEEYGWISRMTSTRMCYIIIMKMYTNIWHHCAIVWWHIILYHDMMLFKYTTNCLPVYYYCNLTYYFKKCPIKVLGPKDNFVHRQCKKWQISLLGLS